MRGLRQKIIIGFVTISLFFSIKNTVYAAIQTELLTKPWALSATSGPTELYQLIDPNALKDTTTLKLTYDLKGTCLLDGDASAIIFDQPINQTWRYISLSQYGKNCYNGDQTAEIPLSDFKELDLSVQVGTFHTRIWQKIPYDIEIKSAVLYNIVETNNAPSTNQPTPSNTPTPTFTPTPIPFRSPTPTPIPTPTSTPTPTPIKSGPTPTPSAVASASWSIQSVSSMKETKDRICYQRTQEFINKWVDQAVELGANYVSIETPYDSPTCGDTISYTKLWTNAIRAKGLKVWHRHMPLAFEGIYNTSKNPTRDYLQLIVSFIKNNPFLFAAGDIFTPIPEPQNGGIYGVNYCSYSICIFKNAADFNAWLRNAMDVSDTAFKSIGMGGKIKIGYFGFDGYIAWGDNNPDWNGILEDATVIKMGNITIDHYPEIVGDTMYNDLNELEARYPNIPIIIGEWGTITGGSIEQQVITTMQAARRSSVVGFNYWHMGIGGNESLIREDFSRMPHFDKVQAFYKRLR